MVVVNLLVSGECAGCLIDCGANTRIGAAAAYVAAHGFINLLFIGCGRVFEQAYGCHNLTRLAVAALGDVIFDPGLLYHLTYAISFDAFYRCDGSSGYRRHRCYTGTDGSAVHMHRTGSAYGYATTEFSADHTQLITKYPQQRHVVRDVNILFLTIDLKICHLSVPIYVVRRDGKFFMMPLHAS